MPQIDITNPDVIKFLVENYDKTTRLRLKWNLLHSDKLKKAATLHRAEKGYYETDVFQKAMVAGLEAITRDHVIAGYNRRRKAIRDGIHINGVDDMKRGHSIPEVGLGDPKDDPRLTRPNTDLSIDPLMRPVESTQKEIIYNDLPMFGRVAYLKNRSRMIPEKKYYFRESNGWEYGWRLNDSFFKSSSPSYGRVWRLTRDVKSRTGPHPDPQHYKASDIPGPSKCLM